MYVGFCRKKPAIVDQRQLLIRFQTAGELPEANSEAALNLLVFRRNSLVFNGAGYQSRTDDLLITNQLLYH